MSDRLTLTRALEASGMESTAAERIATEIYDAIHNNVATKADLGRVEIGLKADLERVEIGLKADIAGVRTDSRELEQRLELRFVALERRIDQTVIRIGGLAVVLLTLLFGALHLWPPR
jgi:hypothetical protein